MTTPKKGIYTSPISKIEAKMVSKFTNVKKLVALAITIVLCSIGMNLCVKSQVVAQKVDKPRIAVLTLRNRIKMTKSEIDYLTSVVRQATAEHLSSDYVIMTQENIEVLLPPNTNLNNCVSECQVETGRMIGARYIITGEVLRFGTTLRLTLRMHETKVGRLVASSRIKGKNIEELEEPSVSAVTSMLSKLSPQKSSLTTKTTKTEDKRKSRAQSPSMVTNTIKPAKEQTKPVVQNESDSSQEALSNDAFELSGVSIGAGFLILNEEMSAHVGYRFTKTHQLSVEYFNSIMDRYCDFYDCWVESSPRVALIYSYHLWFFDNWLFFHLGLGVTQEKEPTAKSGLGLYLGRATVEINTLYIVDANYNEPFITLDATYTF